MSKIGNKIRQFALFGLAAATATGVTTVAPPARADEVTATVFSAPGWDYANVRVGPGLSFPVVKTIPAGSSVKLGCWVENEEVQGPYGKSKIWYKADGTDDFISDTMVDTGVDKPVTTQCAGSKPPTPGQPSGFTVKVLSGTNIKYVNALYYHYYKEDMLLGVDAEIDWSFFNNRQWLRDMGYNIRVGEFRQVDQWTSSTNDIDVYTALGGFTLYRTSEHCFLIYDWYDFDHPYETEMEDAKKGDAQEFTVYSSGCYQ